MPLVPGLNPNIRQEAPDQAAPMGDDVVIEFAANDADQPVFDDDGNVISIEHGDGSVTISRDGAPLERANSGEDGGWFGNLVERIPQDELGRISGDLLRGVDDDLSSRRDWVEAREQGLKLLGLKIEIPGLTGSAEGAPIEGMSKVRHPLLLEAVLRFQANARSELLPTDGPVKVRNDDNNAELNEDQTADALQKDLNHYLTVTASEYYPDTDRMLLMLGFGGTAFKKVYYCPLRNRPVSETVNADDLIVNNNATDLKNAKRITHRVNLRPSTVKRLQILGVYRDVSLSQPLPQKLDSAQRAEKEQQGVSADSSNPEDRNREIYECYCELDIKGYEHRLKGKETGLEIPYRVTIDVSSREILSIVRNYDEDTEDLPEARSSFVKYIFVPGFGFYDIGLLHILGNTTNAITAAWREMLDAGMYANFPGFLISDAAGRQNTNIFRIPPGGGQQVKTGQMPIRDAVMPLPYKDPSQALMNLVDNMTETGQRVGGTSELQVGEGRAEAPVGTTLALIEQATKIMNSVHKRLHAAQAEEFRLLKQCFKDNPESFWQQNRKPAMPWDEKTFLVALGNCELTPQADPNTASQAQRMMKIVALKQLQAANPQLYDAIAVDTAAMQALGWNNPQQFFAPPSVQGAPPPKAQEAMAKNKVDQQRADADTMRAQADVAETKAKIDQGAFAPEPGVDPGGGGSGQIDTPVDQMDAETRAEDARTRAREADIKAAGLHMDAENAAQDRQSDEQATALQVARDIMKERQENKREDRRLKSDQKVAAQRVKRAPKEKPAS